MTKSPKNTRRSLLAGLSAASLGLALAVVPAASASAASASIGITNNCGHNINVSIYRGSNWVLGGLMVTGQSSIFHASSNLNQVYTIVLPKGTYSVYLGDGYTYLYRAC